MGATHFGLAALAALLGLLFIAAVEILTYAGPVITIAMLVGKRNWIGALIWGTLSCAAITFRVGMWMRWF